MRHSVALAMLCIVGIVPWFGHTLFSSQVVPTEKQDKEKGLEGVWTQICYEAGGRVVSLLPTPSIGKQGPKGGPPGFFTATFTKDTFETGPDNSRVPPTKCAYLLNPGNKTGAIDFTPLDKDGKAITKDKIEAIYLLKDDYLIICRSVVRPEHFTTSLAPNTTTLGIYRRGRQT